MRDLGLQLYFNFSTLNTHPAPQNILISSWPGNKYIYFSRINPAGFLAWPKLTKASQTILMKENTTKGQRKVNMLLVREFAWGRAEGLTPFMTGSDPKCFSPPPTPHNLSQGQNK